MRVSVDVEEVVLENDYEHEVNGVRAFCRRCDHETESFGTSERFVKRCLVLMREECPMNESNFYVAGDDED